MGISAACRLFYLKLSLSLGILHSVNVTVRKQSRRLPGFSVCWDVWWTNSARERQLIDVFLGMVGGCMCVAGEL